MTVDEQSLAWWRALPPMHITNWPLTLELPEYSATNPTGVTIGKRWRRNNGSFDQRFILQGGVPRWVICEYAEAPDEMQGRWDEKQGKYVRVPVQMAKTVMYRPVVRVKMGRREIDPGEVYNHYYHPSFQAMGDCRVCGHDQKAPWHL